MKKLVELLDKKVREIIQDCIEYASEDDEKPDYYITSVIDIHGKELFRFSFTGDFLRKVKLKDYRDMITSYIRRIRIIIERKYYGELE